jgi:peptidyl-dipeptidase Dcp
MPQALIDKVARSAKFNQGFATVEYLAASYLDLCWHMLTESPELDTNAFERQVLERIGLIPEIVTRYRSTYFTHIFAGGYAAGYYSYIWAEVLDADAFQAFEETTLFDQETAARFRTEILARGRTEDPMVLYKRFRGAEPSIEPLLEKRGLTGVETTSD